MKTILSLTLVGLLAHSINLNAAQAANTHYDSSLQEKTLLEQISSLEKELEAMIITTEKFETQALLVDYFDYIFKTVQQCKRKLRGIAHRNIQVLQMHHTVLTESLNSIRNENFSALLSKKSQN